MTYDAILFDMDGVLLTGYHTSRSVYRQAVAATLADFGHDGDADPPPGLVDPDTVADIRTACDDISLPASPVWAYRERASTTIENEQIVAGERTTFPDVGVLETLAGSYTLGVVSNNRQGTARFVADHFGLPVEVVRGRFPTIEEFGSLKPDPTFVTWALDRLETTDVLYVGDRFSDVEAAHAAGIDAALLARGGERPDGEGDPEHVIESLSELPERL